MKITYFISLFFLSLFSQLLKMGEEQTPGILPLIPFYGKVESNFDEQLFPPRELERIKTYFSDEYILRLWAKCEFVVINFRKFLENRISYLEYLTPTYINSIERNVVPRLMKFIVSYPDLDLQEEYCHSVRGNCIFNCFNRSKNIFFQNGGQTF